MVNKNSFADEELENSGASAAKEHSRPFDLHAKPDATRFAFVPAGGEKVANMKLSRYCKNKTNRSFGPPR